MRRLFKGVFMCTCKKNIKYKKNKNRCLFPVCPWILLHCKPVNTVNISRAHTFFPADSTWNVFLSLAERLFSHWNVNQVDLANCSWAKQQANLAIFRNTLHLFHGELTREKHISSYQSNRKWRVSSSTPNQDRSCSEMCLGIVPISLFPSRFFSCSLVPGGGRN